MTAPTDYQMSPFAEVMHHFLQWFLRRASKIYFRELRVIFSEREGASTTPTPTLIIANHPNGLIDPLLILVTARQIVRFVAKNTLWDILLLRPILKITGAVPVFRQQDATPGDKPGHFRDANQRSLEAAAEALARHSFGIFPEGRSHDEPLMDRFKTGPTRILLTAVLHSPAAEELGFQAAGLYFDEKTVFRSRALVHYGPRYPLKDLLSAEELAACRAGEISPELVKRLTLVMEESFHHLLPSAANAAERQLIRRLAMLLLTPRRKKKVREFYRWQLRARDVVEKMCLGADPHFKQLYADITAYFTALRAHVFSDRIVRDVAAGEARFFLRSLRRQLKFWSLSVLGLPFIILGVALYWAPYRLIGRLASRQAEDQTEIATYKFLLGVPVILFFTVIYVLLLTVVAYLLLPAPWTLLGSALLPPFSAFAALLFAERQDERWEDLRFLLLPANRQLVKELGEKRELLLECLDALEV